ARVRPVVQGLRLPTAAGLLVPVLAAPLSEWTRRAPDISASIREKLYEFDRPLAGLRELQKPLMPSAGPAVAVEPSQISMVTPVVAFVTPAVAQMVVFVATLFFFLAGQTEFRQT